jgi:hypothetical protein
VATALVLEQGITRAWLGGSDATAEGSWLWISDGSAFWTGTSATTGGAPVGSAYVNWAPGEPSGGSMLNCAALAGTSAPGEGTWSDESCTTQRPFVCRGPEE